MLLMEQIDIAIVSAFIIVDPAFISISWVLVS